MDIYRAQYNAIRLVGQINMENHITKLLFHVEKSCVWHQCGPTVLMSVMSALNATAEASNG